MHQHLREIIKRSITGINFMPVTFYVFLHDIFYFVLKSTIYNYADDKTVSFIQKYFNFSKI